MDHVWSGVFMSKVMQVFMNLDRMIGRDFEAGLANLKKLTENRAFSSEVATGSCEENAKNLERRSDYIVTRLWLPKGACDAGQPLSLL